MTDILCVTEYRVKAVSPWYTSPMHTSMSFFASAATSLAFLGIEGGVALAQAPVAPVAAPAPAAAVQWPTDAKGLDQLATKLATGWFDAAKAKDPDRSSAMLAPCFQMVTYRGAVDTAGVIAQLKGVTVGAVTLAGMSATRVGDALVATWTVAGEITLDGNAMPSSASPRVAVWQIIEGGWKLTAMGSLTMPTVRPAATAPSFAGETALNSEGQAMLLTFLNAQIKKDIPTFEKMLAPGMQVVNFKGQKVAADLVQGAKHATVQPPTINDARATRCGDLTIVSCNLGMAQKIGFTSLPGTPVPFLVVFSGTGDAAKVIAIGNTNRPD